MNSDFDTEEDAFECDPPVFDAANYPCSYRKTTPWLALQVLGSLALMAAGAGLLAVAVFPHSSPEVLQAWQAVSVPAAVGLLVIAGAGLVDVRRARVVLHADAIEVHGLLGTRVVRLDAIIGRRRLLGHGAVAAHLLTAPGTGRGVRLPFTLATDNAFHAWLARVPDLDAADRNASLLAIAENTVLGRTPDERVRRLAQINGIAQLATWGMVGLLAWVTYSAHVPAVVLLAIGLLPWLIVAAVACSRGVLRLAGSSYDVRPDLLGVLSLACLTLLPRLLIDINLNDWVPVVPVALAAGAGMSVWPLWLSARQGQSSASRWMIVPLLWVYCCAASTWINVLGDRRTVRADQTTVTFKHVSSGRTPAFSLWLDPWGSLRETQTLKVSRAVFNSVSPGETVCVSEHPGLWGWHWTDVAPCPQAAATFNAGSMPSPLYRALKLGAYEPQRRGPRLRMLLEARYAELDSQLGELQRQFERGERGSDLLLTTYRDFYDPNPDLDTLFDAWIARFPDSYPAYLARGIHRKFQAEKLHAAGFERWVSAEFNVEAYADRQIEDLEHSTRLTSKPTLSYVHLMDAAMHRGQREQMGKWLERGLAAEPDSFVLRRKYLAMLRPMYGGSLQAMEAFVADCRRDGTPPNVMKTLDAMLLTQRGWASQNEGREDDALALFRQAAALGPYGEDLNMALRQEADILIRRKQFDPAIALLRRAIQTQPDEPNTHGMLGYALHQAGHRPEAIDEYKRAAELGDSRSQGYVGRLYLHGDGVDRDTARAAYWLNRAALGGNGDAKRELRERPELRSP